jgi:hypothetical protein
VQPCSTCLQNGQNKNGQNKNGQNIGQGGTYQGGGTQNGQNKNGQNIGQGGTYQGGGYSAEQRNWNGLQQDYNARGQGGQWQQQYQGWRNSGSRGTLWRRP